MHACITHNNLCPKYGISAYLTNLSIFISK